MNQGVHTVDLLVWALGRPVEISAQTGLLAHDRIEVEDTAVATVRFAGGALGVVHCTTAAYPGLSARYAVYGTHGSAIVDDDRLAYFHIAPDTATLESAATTSNATAVAGAVDQKDQVVPPEHVVGGPAEPDHFAAGHARQYTDIVDAIRQGREPGVTVDAALVSLATVRGALRQRDARAARAHRRRDRGEVRRRGAGRRHTRNRHRDRRSSPMKFSVFTASTPDWTPSVAAETLAAQGWDGIEWRIVDDRPADGAEVPAERSFWAGNDSTWQYTGIRDRVGEIARITDAAGLEYSGIGGYQPAADHDGVETMLRVTSELGARQVRVTMPNYRAEKERTGETYPRLFDRTRTDLEWAADRAAELGVKVLVEPPPHDHHTVGLGGTAVDRRSRPRTRRGDPRPRQPRDRG